MSEELTDQDIQAIQRETRSRLENPDNNILNGENLLSSMVNFTLLLIQLIMILMERLRL